MNKSIKRLYLVLIIITTSVSCQTNSLPDELNMTASELKNAIDTDSNLVVLDVRMPTELTGPLGKIDGAINIPVQELAKRLDELERYKNSNIAVICRSGNRSVTATEILQSNGYSVKNVIGGMIAFNGNN